MTEPRRVVVTGAGSGLGRAIAERMARAGDRVVGTVRSDERARALGVEAKEAGLALSFLPLELGDRDSIARFVEEVLAGGGVDVLVNNAGAGVFGAVEEITEEDADWQMQVNLLGPLALTRRLLPTLRERRGAVVFVGSLAGRLALPFQAHYSASKAALAAMSDALRMELLPHGVRVTCVEPGDFATGFTDARRIANTDDSPYGVALARCREAVERGERQGAAPERLARLVDDLSRQSSPPARRPAGRWARLIALLHRLLPDRLRERLVRSTYGV